MHQADLLITHARIVTMDDEMRVLQDGALAVQDKKILLIDHSDQAAAQVEAETVIDASGRILMPGLINTHTHLATVLFRGLAEDMPLEPWLQKIWQAENAILSPQSVAAGSSLAMVELLLGGTTCAVDMYWFPEQTAAAARSIGFRLVNGPVFLLMDQVPDGFSLQDRIAFSHDFLQHYLGDDLIHPMIMPHSTYTDPPEMLRIVQQIAKQYGLIIHTHTSETIAEIEEVRQRYGCTPVHHLYALGILESRMLLAHCVHVSEEEIEIMANSGAVVAHNPLSNMKLASGFAPLRAMKSSGIPITIGTDGAQSGNDLDMWWSMRLAALLQKGTHMDASLFKADEMLRMATIQAAQGIGLGDRIGSLEPGKLADMILIDLNAPHLVPMYDLYAHLVYAVGREDVHSVWVNGAPVIQNRQLVTSDLEEITHHVHTLAADVPDRML
ncbi:MAG: amidohydrolase [Anaerolineales bacterium]|nr:amidohydrolase [Anaerolineales bacterium]